MRWKYWLVGGFALAAIVIIALLFWLGFVHESGSAPAPAHPVSLGISWLWPVFFVCLLAFAIGWAIGGKWGKVVQAVAATIAIFAIGSITWRSAEEWFHSHSSANAPQAMVAQSCTANAVWWNEALDWASAPTFTIAAHGASPRVKKCFDTHLRWHGDHLIIHAVYGSTECVMTPGVTCPDGVETEEYVTNDSDAPTLASYALAHPWQP